MQTEKNLADMTVIGRMKLESEIHDDDELDKIPTHHLVFCPLGFIPTTVKRVTRKNDNDLIMIM